ncbi:MAG: hypothetical protein IJ247_05810 [Bacilli bacterium]|nr:hypothetical protein [Bacilli bacterium]
MNEDLRWLKCHKGYQSVYFVHDFYLAFVEGYCLLDAYGSNDFMIFVNGEEVGDKATKEECFHLELDISKYLKNGFNRIGFLMKNTNQDKIESLLSDEMKCAFTIRKDNGEFHSSEDGMLYKKKEDGDDDKWSLPMNIEGFSTAEPTFFEKK